MYYLPIYRVQIGDLGSRLTSLSVTAHTACIQHFGLFYTVRVIYVLRNR